MQSSYRTREKIQVGYTIPLVKMTLSQQQIAKLRKRLQWSQATMARALGITNPKTISQWETSVRAPTATAMRFLCLLDGLSKPELRKISKRLEQIAQDNFTPQD